MKGEPSIISRVQIDSFMAWRMLGWLLLAQILVAMVGRSIAPLGPLIAEDLQLTNAQIGLFPSFLFIGQMLVSIPSGLLVDKVGTRKLLFVLCLCLGLAYFIASMLPSFVTILLFILIGGMAYGTMHPVTNRGILYWFPERRRGTAMGIKQMGVTFGSALAAIILLPFALVMGWRIAMASACLLLIVVGAISYWRYRERPIEEKVMSEEKGSLFAQVFSVAKHPPLLMISIVAFFLNGSQMTLTMYMIFYVGNELLFGLAIAGAMLVLTEVAGSIGRVAWGTISDTLFKGSRFAVMLLLTILAFSGTLAMAFFETTTPLWVMIPVIFILGLTVTGFNGVWMNIATELTPPDKAGLASGVSLTIGSMGVVIFPPIFGLAVDLSGNFSLAWLLMSSLLMFACFLLLVLRKITAF